MICTENEQDLEIYPMYLRFGWSAHNIRRAWEWDERSQRSLNGVKLFWAYGCVGET
jgi:hypothetical protein